MTKFKTVSALVGLVVTALLSAGVLRAQAQLNSSPMVTLLPPDAISVNVGHQVTEQAVTNVALALKASRQTPYSAFTRQWKSGHSPLDVTLQCTQTTGESTDKQGHLVTIETVETLEGTAPKSLIFIRVKGADSTSSVTNAVVNELQKQGISVNS